MFLRYDVIFAGRVQGVFFRATTEQLARDFSVTGYVRNRSDGTVHCVAEGEQQEACQEPNPHCCLQATRSPPASLSEAPGRRQMMPG